MDLERKRRQFITLEVFPGNDRMRRVRSERSRNAAARRILAMNASAPQEADCVMRGTRAKTRKTLPKWNVKKSVKVASSRGEAQDRNDPLLADF